MIGVCLSNWVTLWLVVIEVAFSEDVIYSKGSLASYPASLPTLEEPAVMDFASHPAFLGRRAFMGASLAGLAASQLLGADFSPKGLDESPFQPNTLFLTWQRDPTTTMTVQWVGTVGETSDTKIYYSRVHSDSQPMPLALSALPAASSIIEVAKRELKVEPWLSQKTTTKPYPMTDFKVFRAELTGLAPDTDYMFRIGMSSPTYRFRTMPAKATNTIHFISGGDCGINAHTVANNIQAARQDPMFCVIGGDLGYDNGRSVETSLAFLRNYSRHMVGRDGRLIPMLACLGNHEVDGGYNKPRGKAPFFYALFDGLYPETGFASLDFGDYLSLILLDTGHTTAIGGLQTDWLARTLAARAEHPNVLVVNHVPAYPSARSMSATTQVGGKEVQTGTGEENRKHWVPLFEKYRVPVVLEHHDHTFKRTKPLLNGVANENGVLYLGDGSWGQLRSPNKPEKLTHLAQVNRDYHLSLHRIQGEERFHIALDEAGRLMDVCRSAQRKTGAVALPANVPG